MKKIFFGVFFVILVFLIISQMAYLIFDRPIAATFDDGRSIYYFEIPSEDKKDYEKIFPGTKKFQEILKKGDYGYINVAPPEVKEETRRGF